LVLDLVRIENSPTDPLHELSRKVIRLEISNCDSLAKQHRALLVLSYSGPDDDLRHPRLLWSGGFSTSVLLGPSEAVKDR
jgi:hypothetical protein